MSKISAIAVKQEFHPCLPSGMTLSHVIELIERVGKQLGLGLSRRAALIRMIRHTKAKDWISSDRDPVCFRAQQDIAQELGITSRAVRSHEHALSDIGLVMIDTTANGRRSGRILSDGRRLGLNFRPLIENIGWLIQLDEAYQAERRRIESLRLECSAAKRDLRLTLEQLLTIAPRSSEVTELLQFYADLPRRYAGFRSVKALQSHLEDIETAVDTAVSALSCRQKSSGRAESRIPAILNTTLNISESCSGSSALNRTARNRTDDKTRVAPDGANNEEKKVGDRNANGNPDDVSWLTPEIIRSIAGENFRFCLDSLCLSDDEMTERTLRSAAIMILPDLGVNASAWEDALDVFGSLRAALVILIIDANKHHPTHPIHSPGGTLRAFTRLQSAGKFNIAGSLIGLIERTRKMK